MVYLSTVQIEQQSRLPPALIETDRSGSPRGDQRKAMSDNKDMTMSLAAFERALDKSAGLFFLLIGVISAGTLAAAIM
jgi:hypothetical protein